MARLKSYIEENYDYEKSFEDDSKDILKELFSEAEDGNQAQAEEDEEHGILVELDEDQETIELE